MIANHISTGASFRVDCLVQVLRTHGVPDVFNGDQSHQALSYKTPSEVNKTGVGVGAVIFIMYS
jgi:hypothetical protein